MPVTKISYKKSSVLTAADIETVLGLASGTVMLQTVIDSIIITDRNGNDLNLTATQASLLSVLDSKLTGWIRQ